ncbi:SGNH/GDSL hydrolase family protein [Thermospira aquatica]|uniref:SGNH/GDSL hydrolase family protein n=1 Tax=Thermospira aquatica TaxID=2828656 RepID=A0AAX3BF00_9SPIR|nr:hypothetical protein [Thermospira aquatica]URA10804.1 SGNH/GDSL hydrolase family protein [Thermospira aquatica]
MPFTKKILFTMVFFFILAGCFFTLEGIFRLAGIGYPTQPFQRARFVPQYYKDNPNFTKKYYPSSPLSEPSVHFHNLFPTLKSPGTLRLFVVGGSTAQGFPYYPNHSFSKIIEKALETTGLYERVEVINLGFSALSSYYVADVAPKLLRYQPDALIIYAGQNEYYGTLTSLEKPSWMQKLYLALKEWRIFQWLFSLIETRKTLPDESLMSQQFANKRIPADRSLDDKIARDFIRNLQSVVKKYRFHRIPVFVYEPVANLIDMPPFSSENESELKTLLTPYRSLFTNPTLLAEKLSKENILDMLQARFPSNAHVLYLAGLKAKSEGKPFLELLEKAKDNDTTPFRYRSPLQHALRNFIENETNKGYLAFIPLQDIIINKRGSNSFDNSIFIDHLHFNRTGQALLAQTFCESWLTFTKANSNAFRQVAEFFTLSNEREEAIFMHPLYDFEAQGRIIGLLQKPPYSLMLFPYRPSFDLTKHPFALTTPSSLLALYSQTNTDDFTKIYFSYLYTNGLTLEIASLVNTIRWLSPSHPQSYYNVAILLSSSNSFSESAAMAWLYAILFSEKTNTTILSNARGYFRLHKKEDILFKWRIKP